MRASRERRRLWKAVFEESEGVYVVGSGGWVVGEVGWRRRGE